MFSAIQLTLCSLGMNSSKTLIFRMPFSFIRTYSGLKTPPIFDNLIPKVERKNETPQQQKARLLYQSRKRGMLENDLLLGTFAAKHLKQLSPELTNQYDNLINGPSNDWDIYNWIVGKKLPPKEYDNEVFRMLKEHTQNRSCEQRYRQPELHF